MKQLFTELLIEIPKIKDQEYKGLVVVHPDDVAEVIEFICNKVNNNLNLSATVNHKYNDIKVVGEIKVATTEPKDWQFNHAGMQYTTILINLEAFGKAVFDLDGNYVDYKPVGINSEHGISYMISRMRSNSGHSPRMVIC